MTKKTNVVIVSEFFPRSAIGEARGGVEMRCWHIAQRLTDDYDVTVITSREPKLPDTDQFGEIHVLRRGPVREYSQVGSPMKRLKFMIDVYKSIVTLQPKVIDAQSYVAYLPAFYAAKKVGAFAIATYHDVWKGRWTKLFGLVGLIGEVYERICLSKKWDLFIANSHFTKKGLVSAGIHNSNIEVVHNGIDLEMIQSIEAEKYLQPTICSITRLVSYKRVIDLINAVAIVKDQLPTIQCKIIGTGPDLSLLKKEIQKRALTDTIELLGFVSSSKEVMRILQRSQVFCLPSEIEGFGIVVAEAMASKVPVVATNIPPIVEVTQQGKGAVLVKPRSVEELAKALVTLLTDLKLQKQYIEHGAKIAQEYNWDTIGVRVADLYKNILL